MEHSKNKEIEKSTVKITHDLKRQILEITSLIRVINNYYNKKAYVEEQIKPIILKKFEESLRTLKDNRDWLYTIPTAIDKLSDDLITKKDSFKFPDSIILFESWMNLGYNALYPRHVLHYKFPGFLKGEKTRNVFQFTFSTSRGFGFPIYFGPEFYGYILSYGKILEPILKWCHSVCHRANQAIFLVGKRYNIKRHHPGEFESVIISEYENSVFKGIDTLLHGYFTNDPKKLGNFSSLETILQNIIFSYSIGDHAMSIETKSQKRVLDIPMITHDDIVANFNVDFYSYIKKLMLFRKLLIKKILYYRNQRKNLINQLKRIDKIKLRIDQSKNFSIPSLKISKKFSEIEKFGQYIRLNEKILQLLFTTPLYTHTLHKPISEEEGYIIYNEKDKLNLFKQDTIDSIFQLYIKYYKNKYDIVFKEKEVIKWIEALRDEMGKMWLYFKERQFNLALKRLSELSSLSLDDKNYNQKVNEYLDNLIPIFSIYEIFNRSLSESVYPEAIPRAKRLGAYLASFLTSRYNFFGVNLMNLFNKLAFYNWSYFILKKRMNKNQFFNFILKLPIWKHIPIKVKMKILKKNI